MITIFNLIGGFGGNSQNVYPQDRPTLTTPQTRLASGLTLAGSLFQADLTSKHVILSGAFADGLAINGIENAIGDPLLLTNEDSNTLIGTSSLAASAMTIVGDTNNLEIWGKDKNTIFPLRAGSGQSGLIFAPQIGGSTIRMYNILAEDVGYSGLLFTVPSSGGSYHRKTIGAFLAVDGLVTEGEAYYFGHVSTDTPHNYLSLVHCAGKDKGRNGFQHKWGLKTRCYNHTYRNVAQVADTAQNQLFQIEVCKDTKLYDFIFDGGKYAFNIFTHDLTVDGGFSRFTVGAGYIGKASTFWPGHANLNGVKVIFKNHTFIFDNAGTGYLAQWEETGCDLEFQNCRFSDNINSSIVQDIRVGGTNNLVGTTTTNGNTSVAKATLLAEMPTYKSDDPYNKDFCNLIPGTKWFNLGAGKGSPTKRTVEILDCKELAASTVVYGTTFASLSLPSTVSCFLSNGSWVDLPISWAQGSYDGNVAGTYTIYGTPSGYSNTDGNKVEKSVTVEAYVNPNTVRVNLAGSGGAYVSTGNWNNIFAAGFSTGVQTIKGDNSGETLASLRNVGGSLTGYQINIVTGFDTGALGENSGGGIYPDNAIIGTWANPGASGTSRSFKLTGLDNSKTYIFRIMSSVDADIVGSSHLVTVQVSGASGGSTVTDYEADSNKTVVNTFTGCVPTGGEITIRVEKRTAGQAVVNLLDFEWS